MKTAEKRKKRVSAQRRLAEHHTGLSKTSLNIPKGAKLFQVEKEGVHKLDIIPYEVGKGNPFADEGDLYYERTYYTHRAIGPNEETFVCAAKTYKKPCPICDHIKELREDTEANEDLIKALLPKERQIWNVIDTANREDGVQIWEISHHLFGAAVDDKLRKRGKEKPQILDFADLENGMTLSISAKEKKIGKNAFFDCTDIEFDNRSMQYTDAILEGTYCLDDIPVEPDYKALKATFLQEAPAEEDESEDEAPVRQAVKKVEKEDSEQESPKKEAKAEVEDDSVDDGLKIGQKVAHEDFGVCTIIKVSGDGTSLTLETKKGKVLKAVSPTEIELLDDGNEQDVIPMTKKTAVVEEDEDEEDDSELEDDSDLEDND